jgi:3-dehydroquinate synthase
VYQHFADLGVDRATHVVALGGGMVGDLAGFAAATYLRGLPLIQVPTTVLSQADSSIGGKTGVDLERGKNLVGAFHQPRLVVVDPRMTRTLPLRQIRSGFAEIIKVGMALDATLFRQLEREGESLLGLEEDRYLAALVRAVRAKARIVEVDEREKGRRMLLNYGHTVGHALEAAGNYRRWLHGEAVALGMEAAARLAIRKKILSNRDYLRQRDVLERFGFSLALQRVSIEDILSALRLDKKARSGRPAFVLTRRVGVASVHRTLTRKDIVETLRALGAEP